MLRGIVLIFSISATLFGGNVQMLPALPAGAIAQSVQTDSSGNIYVAGVVGAQPADAFIEKLSSDGSHLIYRTVLAGSIVSGATPLAIGADGSAYLTGGTGVLDNSRGAGIVSDGHSAGDPG